MKRKAIFGYPSVIEKLGTGGGDLTDRVEQLELEYESLLNGINNYLVDVKLQTTNANTRTTIDKNNIRSVIAIFDKTKFDYPLSDLVNIEYHRYNTNYDAAWIINFGWYRINSAGSETSSSVDKIYCVFTFLDPAVTETNATDYIGAANRNMLIFRFKKTIGG